MGSFDGVNHTGKAGEEQFPEELFRAFHYPEVKDLGKHFLTLISGSVILSVTFAEKIVVMAGGKSTAFWLPELSSLLLISVLVAGGWGLFRIYLAAEKAAGSTVYDYEGDFRDLARKSYFWLDWAVILFGGALLLLAASGVARVLQGWRRDSQSPNQGWRLPIRCPVRLSSVGSKQPTSVFPMTLTYGTTAGCRNGRFD